METATDEPAATSVPVCLDSRRVVNQNARSAYRYQSGRTRGCPSGPTVAQWHSRISSRKAFSSFPTIGMWSLPPVLGSEADPAVLLLDQDAFTLRQGLDHFAGEPEGGGLDQGAVADGQASGPLGELCQEASHGLGQAGRLPLDELRVAFADEVDPSPARGLGGGPPPVLDRGAQALGDAVILGELLPQASQEPRRGLGGPAGRGGEHGDVPAGQVLVDMERQGSALLGERVGVRLPRSVPSELQGPHYFTMCRSTNSRPKPSVKFARSWVLTAAVSLAMSALKPSRSSQVSSATPSNGRSCPSGTRVTRCTTYPVRCSYPSRAIGAWVV